MLELIVEQRFFITAIILFAIGLATPASTLVQILLCCAYWRMLARREQNALAA